MSNVLEQFVDDNVDNCYLDGQQQQQEHCSREMSSVADLKSLDDSGHESSISRMIANYREIVNNDRQLVEGIGNEVLFTILVALFAIVLYVTFYLIQRYSNITRVSHSIHPSNLVAVNDARSQVHTSASASASIAQSPFLSNYHQQHRRHFATMDSNCPVCLNQLRYPIETNCGHLFCAQCIIIYWQHAQWRGGAIKCPVCRQQVTIMLPCFSTANTRTAGTSSPPVVPSSPTSSSSSTFQANSVGSNSIDSTSSSSTSSSLPNLINSPFFNGDPSIDSFDSQPQQPEDPQQERIRLVREINSYNRRFSGESRPWFDYLYDLPTLLRHMSMDFFSFNGLVYVFRIRIVLCFMAAIMYLISPLDMIPEAVFGIFGLLDDIVVVVLLAIYVTIIYRRFLLQRWEMD